jgi:glutamate-1-semialdehyde 2,1-aminomutase
MVTKTLDTLLEREQAEFRRTHPRSQSLYVDGQGHYLYGAPSHWMRRWAGGFPLFVDAAIGTSVRCVDGLEYIDFCLGDSGGMCGHAVESVTAAVSRRLAAGATFMLPTEDALWVGTELARRFGLPYWGFTTSASEANRAVIRMARMVTGRPRVLVFNGCYHGSVSEAHVALVDGRATLRNGIHPNGFDYAGLTRVVEFNDIDAAAAALESCDVACVLTEPCLTNFGLIEAQPGFLSALREVTRRAGTLLIMDETHTISAGPGGYTRRERLDPDAFVIGKALGGGIPVGVYGLAEHVARRMWELFPKANPARVRQSAHLGFGGTLAGSALQVAAVRAVLSEVLTETNFARMIGMAERLAGSAREVIGKHALPWHIAQSGARVETMWSKDPPANASEVARARDDILEACFHVYCLNRGIIVTPFHCMLLMSPATKEVDVERYTIVFEEFCREISSIGCAPAVRP